MDNAINKVTDPDFEPTENMIDIDSDDKNLSFAFSLVDSCERDTDEENNELEGEEDEGEEREDLEKNIAHEAVGVLDQVF
ncbi:hypothetical protein C0995_016075, partial [Termitomyces sp. Mi166